MGDCIFCKIIEGKIPSFKIFENDNFLAFLDAFPTMKGQVLVIPKKHENYLFDLMDKDYLDLMNFVKKVSNVLKMVFCCKKVGIVVEGLEVNHVHIKLYPLFEEGLDLTSKINISSGEMREIASKISSNFEELDKRNL